MEILVNNQYNKQELILKDDPDDDNHVQVKACNGHGSGYMYLGFSKDDLLSAVKAICRK